MQLLVLLVPYQNGFVSAKWWVALNSEIWERFVTLFESRRIVCRECVLSLLTTVEVLGMMSWLSVTVERLSRTYWEIIRYLVGFFFILTERLKAQDVLIQDWIIGRLGMILWIIWLPPHCWVVISDELSWRC